MTGGFPAPAPIAFLPDDSMAFTTPGPPVQTSILTSGLFTITSAVCMVGFATEQTKFAGPPQAIDARLTKSTA